MKIEGENEDFLCEKLKRMKKTIKMTVNSGNFTDFWDNFGGKIDKLINVCVKTNKKSLKTHKSIELFHEILFSALLTYLKTENYPLKTLNIALKLTSKLLHTAISLQIPSIYTIFDRFDGGKISSNVVFYLEKHFFLENRYFHCIFSIPLFSTHQKVPFLTYKSFISDISQYFSTNFPTDFPVIKKRIRILQEIDREITTFFPEKAKTDEKYTDFKRIQVLYCLQTLKTTAFPHQTLPYFSTLLSHYRSDPIFTVQLSLQSISTEEISILTSKVVNELKTPFFQSCLLANFSVPTIWTAINTYPIHPTFILTYEFFSDLLFFRRTAVLSLFSPAIIRYCKRRFGLVGKMMVLNGVEYDFVRKFSPEMTFSFENLLNFANSTYTIAEKGRILRFGFSTVGDLRNILNVAEEGEYIREKTLLLAIFQDRLVREGMWLWEKSLWRRLPAYLFVALVKDYY